MVGPRVLLTRLEFFHKGGKTRRCSGREICWYPQRARARRQCVGCLLGFPCQLWNEPCPSKRPALSVAIYQSAGDKPSQLC